MHGCVLKNIIKLCFNKHKREEILLLRKEHQEENLRIKHEYLLYSAIFLNTLIVVVNTSMFNVALPSIAVDFNLSPGASSLIVSSYSTVFAISAVLYSKLSNSFQLKNLLTFGMLCLAVGSLLGMFSNAFYLLVLARVIQAAGASSISALGIIITTRYIPFYRRGAAMARVAAAVTLGFGLGPLLGGVITEYTGWENLFAISILAILTIPVYQYLLPREASFGKKMDVLGLLWLVGGIVSLLLLLATKNSLFIPGILCLWLFWKHIEKAETPFIQPDTLKNRTIAYLFGIVFMTFFINFAIMFVTPLLLVEIFQVTNVAKLGLILFPAAILSSLASNLIGRAVDRFGAMKVILAGICCLFLATFSFSAFGYQSIVIVLIAFIIGSSGFVCITTGVPNLISEHLPPDQANTAIGTLQLCQYIGGAFGVTISGLVLDQFALSKALNPFWHHSGNEFSQAYLFLSLIAMFAGILYYTLNKKQRSKNVPFQEVKKGC